jgi:hypothetical protein
VAVGVTLWLPDVATLPLKLPAPAVALAAQEAALLEDQLSRLFCPRVMAVGLAPMFTVGKGGLTLTVAAAETLPAVLVQVRV